MLTWCHCLTGGIDHGYYPILASFLFCNELLMQALWNPKSTLPWAEMNNSWQQFPGPITQYHLPAGQGIYDFSQDQVDFRPILRESASWPKIIAPFDIYLYQRQSGEWYFIGSGPFLSAICTQPIIYIYIRVDVGSPGSRWIPDVKGNLFCIEGTK